MTTKCVACGGSGKSVAGVKGSGVILGECGICLGTGNVSQGLIDALEGAKKAMVDQAYNPNVGTGKKKSKKVTTVPTIPDAGTGVGDVVKGVGSQVADAFIAAGKQKIATEAMHGMVNVSKQLAAKVGWELPPNPVVDKGLALGMPVLLMLIAQLIGTQAPNVVPKMLLDNLNAAATYALQGVSKETVEELAAVALPALFEFAQIGAQALGQLHAGSGQLGMPQAMLGQETEQ